jgi:hypothetical protein
MAAERDLHRLLASLEPELRAGEYVFVSVADDRTLPSLATVREEEGTSHVLVRSDADEYGLAYDFVAAWITLRVHSALQAVGLTAAVAGALADAGISANVIAGTHHDHLLVPYDRAAEALEVLRSLASGSR